MTSLNWHARVQHRLTDAKKYKAAPKSDPKTPGTRPKRPAPQTQATAPKRPKRKPKRQWPKPTESETETKAEKASVKQWPAAPRLPARQLPPMAAHLQCAAESASKYDATSNEQRLQRAVAALIDGCCAHLCAPGLLQPLIARSALSATLIEHTALVLECYRPEAQPCLCCFVFLYERLIWSYASATPPHHTAVSDQCLRRNVFTTAKSRQTRSVRMALLPSGSRRASVRCGIATQPVRPPAREPEVILFGADVATQDRFDTYMWLTMSSSSALPTLRGLHTQQPRHVYIMRKLFAVRTSTEEHVQWHLYTSLRWQKATESHIRRRPSTDVDVQAAAIPPTMSYLDARQCTNRVRRRTSAHVHKCRRPWTYVDVWQRLPTCVDACRFTSKLTHANVSRCTSTDVNVFQRTSRYVDVITRPYLEEQQCLSTLVDVRRRTTKYADVRRAFFSLTLVQLVEMEVFTNLYTTFGNLSDVLYV